MTWINFPPQECVCIWCETWGKFHMWIHTFCMLRPIDMSSFGKVSHTFRLGMDAYEGYMVVCGQGQRHRRRRRWRWLCWQCLAIVLPWAAHASDNAYQISVCGTISFVLLLHRISFHSRETRHTTRVLCVLSHVRHVLMACIYAKNIVWPRPCITLKTLSI